MKVHKDDDTLGVVQSNNASAASVTRPDLLSRPGVNEILVQGVRVLLLLVLEKTQLNRESG